MSLPHFRRMVEHYASRLLSRLMTGSEAHGGRFERKPMWSELEEEWLDLGAYIWKCREDRKDAVALLDKALLAFGAVDEMQDYTTRARNVLIFGNPEGEPEEEREDKRRQRAADWTNPKFEGVSY